MRASDADRDAVMSDLSEHFQAGRLTAEEFDERTGRVLTARTWGELGELVADLPAVRPVSQAASAATGPRSPSRHAAPPLLASLAGLVIIAVVLTNVTHHGWGLIPLLFVLLIARPLVRCLANSLPGDGDGGGGSAAPRGWVDRAGLRKGGDPRAWREEPVVTGDRDCFGGAGASRNGAEPPHGDAGVRLAAGAGLDGQRRGDLRDRRGPRRGVWSQVGDGERARRRPALGD